MDEQDGAPLCVPEQILRACHLVFQQCLALGVDAIQTLGEGLRFRWLLGEQQVEGEMGATSTVVVVPRKQAAGGVEARSQAKGDIDAVGLANGNARDFGQRLDARTGGGADARQAALGQDAILAQQRDDVGHRPHGHQIEERVGVDGALGDPSSRCRLKEGLRQAIGHANAGELAERVGAVLSPRVDDGHRWWQLLGHRVVVCDDEIEAAGPGVGYLLHGTDAAVDGHGQGDAPVPKGLEGGGVQPIGLVKAIGDVGRDLATEGAQGQGQEGGGGDTVGVMVAIDGDGLAGAQCL